MPVLAEIITSDVAQLVSLHPLSTCHSNVEETRFDFLSIKISNDFVEIVESAKVVRV